MTQLHTDIDALPPEATGGVLAIGNFDGVHLGHQALINKAGEIASGGNYGVLTFEPHPRQLFQPEGEPFRLTLLPAKHRAVNAPHLIALTFDKALSEMDGESFIDNILVKKLKARHVVVGADFAFGRNRSGTATTLLNAQRDGRLGVTLLPPALTKDNLPYSSTAIRALLREGDLAGAAAQLGRPWEMEGTIIHGDKRGRALGYPTANQSFSEYVRIPYGIYAVQVLIEGESAWRGGAANFGIRPMFESPQPVFETFIFDFNGDIYGKNMRARPLQRLRPERVFAGTAALIAQMKEDCIAAKAVLESSSS